MLRLFHLEYIFMFGNWHISRTLVNGGLVYLLCTRGDCVGVGSLASVIWVAGTGRHVLSPVLETVHFSELVTYANMSHFIPKDTEHVGFGGMRENNWGMKYPYTDALRNSDR
jgi:hypothetical protein